MVYATPWLRLGLESVFRIVIDEPQTMLQLEPRNPAPFWSPFKLLLKAVFVRCFISDKWLLEKGHAKLREKMLKRLLILVVFLHHAKAANVLKEDGDPNLFEDSLSFQSSNDILECIYCSFVQPQEGGFVAFLSHMGISVPNQQVAVDEVVDEPALDSSTDPILDTVDSTETSIVAAADSSRAVAMDSSDTAAFADHDPDAEDAESVPGEFDIAEAEEVDNADTQTGYPVIPRYPNYFKQAEGMTHDHRWGYPRHKAQIYCSETKRSHELFIHDTRWVAKLCWDVAQLKVVEGVKVDIEMLKAFVQTELEMEKYRATLAGIQLPWE
jgi:hypothetical protein